MEQPTVNYPLSADHYLSRPVVSGLSHSRGPAVRLLHDKLGLTPGDVFSPETEQAVRKWQESVELPVTGVITEIDWVLLFQPER